MPKRWSKSDSTEKNRKQRKQRWINARNLMRDYPDCAYNGDFYCDHIYDSAQPWQWVDFRFFHTKQKRYFSVAMATLNFLALEEIEQEAHDKVLEEMGSDRFSAIPELHKHNSKVYRYVVPDEDLELNRSRMARKEELVAQMANRSTIVRESVELKDYGRVAVGIDARVNTPFIDEHYIRKFIQWFREMGEPITPGWKWEGNEVQTNPKDLLNKGAQDA